MVNVSSTLFASMAFSLCALFYEIFILLMYLSKKKFRNLENSIFIFLLILTFILIFIEIAYVYYLSIPEFVSSLGAFMCRLYLNGILLWLYTFVFYQYALITKPIKDRSIKNTKRKYFLFVLALTAFIAVIISNLLPIYIYTNGSNGLFRFEGPAVEVEFVLALLAILFMIYTFVLKKGIVNQNQKTPMYLCIFFVVAITILQIIVPKADYNIQNFQFVLILMSLFFTLENQDTKLLSEHEESKKEAEEANKEQTEFLTSMSHEIRTPMNTIMGFSDVLIREGALNRDVVKKDTVNIHTAAVSLLELINNILDLSRIESGREKVVNKDFELKSLILDLNNLVYSKINKDKIKFEIIVDENLPSKINGDATKYNKTLSNVLINVLNYTKEGSILLKVTKNENANKFQLNFNVTSDGSYINTEDYEKYYKDDNINSNRINNVVLGINVAKMYASMLNGDIKFDSTYGKNISYNVTLGCNIVDKTPIGNITSLLKMEFLEQQKISLEGRNILVVDDNQINIKLINRLLSEFKPNIDSAINGLECINKVKGKKYDLIFLDHMMPGMDGMETLKRLKATTSDLPPVIALTANSYAGIKEMYVSNGFDDYLAKPINRNDLNKLLYNIFNKDK